MKDFITRKQVNVIYAASKRGDLKVSRDTFSELYDVTELYAKEMNDEERETVAFGQLVVDLIFKSELESAQDIIDRYEGEELHAA